MVGLMVSFVCSSLKNLLGTLFEDYSSFYLARFHVTIIDSKQHSRNNTNGNMCTKGTRMRA